VVMAEVETEGATAGEATAEESGVGTEEAETVRA